MKRPKNLKIGMVFGVFDGLHEGHRHFILQASRRCDSLIIVVARPVVIKRLKDRTPLHSLKKRIERIKETFPSHTVIPGDLEIRTWKTLKQHQPHVVLLGYDQHELANELRKEGVSSELLEPFYPEQYKSSLLRKKKARKK